MICRECREEGLKSTVHMGCTYTTAMHCPTFFDEEGRMHRHDSNVSTTDYRCSNGHRWTERTSGSCWCGWPEKKGEGEQ